MELRRFANHQGKIMHSEICISDSVVMIADANDNYPAIPAWLHVYVEDVDKTYQTALQAGGVSVRSPVRQGG